MRALLQKYGFTYCGIILLENGDPRLAYQRTMTSAELKRGGRFGRLMYLYYLCP
jgi:hypothetical protein